MLKKANCCFLSSSPAIPWTVEVREETNKSKPDHDILKGEKAEEQYSQK